MQAFGFNEPGPGAAQGVKGTKGKSSVREPQASQQPAPAENGSAAHGQERGLEALHLHSNGDTESCPAGTSMSQSPEPSSSTPGLCIICLAPTEAEVCCSTTDAPAAAIDSNMSIAAEQAPAPVAVAEQSSGQIPRGLSAEVEAACCRSCRQQILRPMKARRGAVEVQVAELLPPVFLDRLSHRPSHVRLRRA